jgi:prolipoprotein diacylglyceryl transferase
MVASIPSPSFNSIDIGPLHLNLYGLAIALGVIAAIWLFGRRLEERHVGTREDASAIGLWAVLAGVVGARLYHVVTDWERFDGHLEKIPAIWQGGLGIPGGLLLGIPVGMYVSRRRGIALAIAATCAAPAIPLAQAIGRFGNYFNQELYGRPTDVLWALRIDAAHLEPGYAVGTTFHPTFLYESLWCLGLCLVLLWIDRRFRPPAGQLMVMYVIGYGFGRFWIEGLRIDTAHEIGGVRWNQWVAVAAVVGGVIVLSIMRARQVSPAPIDAPLAEEHVDDVPDDDVPDDDVPDDDVPDDDVPDDDVPDDEAASVADGDQAEEGVSEAGPEVDVGVDVSEAGLAAWLHDTGGEGAEPVDDDEPVDTGRVEAEGDSR